jgi:hypothetical protein
LYVNHLVAASAGASMGCGSQMPVNGAASHIAFVHGDAPRRRSFTLAISKVRLPVMVTSGDEIALTLTDRQRRWATWLTRPCVMLTWPKTSTTHHGELKMHP